MFRKVCLNSHWVDCRKKMLFAKYSAPKFKIPKRIICKNIYIDPLYAYNIRDIDFIYYIGVNILKINKNFKKILQTYLSYERYLYDAKIFYRDNFSHSVKVALFGYELLNFKFRFNKGIHSLLKYLNNLTKISQRSIQDYWLTSSLFHDLCYPITISSEPPDKKVEKLKEIYSYFSDFRVLKPEFEFLNLDEFIEDLNSSTNKIDFEKLIKNIIKNNTTDHGLHSALNLYNLCYKSKNKYLDLIQRTCRAILLHSNLETDFFKKDQIRISDIPITFYLFLIDKIQEWDRKVKDYYSSDLKLFSILDYQTVIIKENEILFQSKFSDLKRLKRAGFKIKKHLSDKKQEDFKKPKFLNPFSKEGIDFPTIKIEYIYKNYPESTAQPFISESFEF